jgi:uncharacterized protein (TIGR04255 family)
MSTRYRDAPLVEAIFEFAPQRAVLSLDDAELLRAELGTIYSGRTDQLTFGGVKVQVSKGQASTVSMPLPPRRRMWTPDGSRLVQFASDLFVFNALAPYSHYVDYLPAMEDLFSRYSARAQPDGTRFLGHRYINQIQLPAEARPRDYFGVYPEIPAHMPAPPHPPFALNLQTEPLSPGQVMMTLSFKGIEAEKPTYLLDIYARTPDDPQISFNWPEVRAWHDNAHEAVKRGFEFAITDQCRQFLGPEED